MQLFYVEQEADVYKLRPSIAAPATRTQFTETNVGFPVGGGFRRSIRRNVNIRPLVSNLLTPPGFIDVINQFDWTTTPNNNPGFAVKAPSIQLVERDLVTSTFAAELQYFLRSFENAVDSSVDGLGDIFTGLINTVKSLGVAEEVQSAQDFIENNQLIQQVTNSTSDFIQGGATRARNALNNVLGNFDNLNSFDLEGVLEPYDGLYLTKQTGFVYNFPYFTNTFRNVTNDFGETYKGVGGAIPSTLLEVGYSGLDLISTPTALTQPGAFIERPKYYQFSSQGESVTFSFPLLNTLSPASVEKNYQLIWMLAYQNRPYRKNRVVINPSRIYTLNIPGVRYVPFAFMSNLDVQFQGTRREVVVNFPAIEGGGMRPVQVIVPEAYQVTITLESLTNESANFMLKSIADAYR